MNKMNNTSDFVPLCESPGLPSENSGSALAAPVVTPLPPGWPWPQRNGRGAGRRAAYILLAEELREMIRSGAWKPGTRLPSEREMQAATRLCPNTIKKALNELDTEGLIYKRQGVGSFVSSRISKDKYRYYRLLGDFDGPSPCLEVESLGCARVIAPPEVARCFVRPAVPSPPEDASFGLASPLACPLERLPGVSGRDWPEQALAGSQPFEVYRLERCFRVDGRPGIWSCSWLPASLLPDFMVRAEACTRMPLYKLLEEAYDLPSLKRQELWSVGYAGPEVARLLEVPARKALLCSEFVNYTLYDRPIEFRTSYMLTDRYKVFRVG